MASMALSTTLSKFQHTRAMVARSPWSSRVSVSLAPRPFQGSLRNGATAAYDGASDAAKRGTNEAMRVGQDMKNKAASTAEDVSRKTKDVTGKEGNAQDLAQDIAEKAKQTAQDAWGSVKDTTQKIKETVAGKAEESKEAIKENAETIKQSMNTKN
ncbi:uncharacterized protein At4g13230 [Cornus florida]|uniref:uncharacterized protein At4g13230 n=1 Tax=Cornus florida TaxID=4283 RepID=UPI00289E2D30|nr:uncharacterized protein At4g13230 [Cornus florida]